MRREELLEAQVRYLAAGVGLAIDDPVDAVPEHVQELARGGDFVQAVRELRRVSDMGLVAAKRTVDAIATQSPAA